MQPCERLEQFGLIDRCEELFSPVEAQVLLGRPDRDGDVVNLSPYLILIPVYGCTTSTAPPPSGVPSLGSPTPGGSSLQESEGTKS